ncbi:MAG: hypothetical protein IPH64_00955 [Comamonadaceae bacterium]|mgnify:FL=1|jgi:hypothetical protein|uniref:hypothetical protein n=1 Tax=Candidatus Skiveiella danica TaxID=3386177 RepID=UPI001B42FCB3|nr:hypothetical protein [Comamonadaceae bacterium]MBK9197730.1 hypothetical protein [Betaproteobacteria bacterium]MBP8100626.1 hypothetical protein [Burkholderiaceae bacterium]MBK6555756.1 hypothetical protein [Comamonadaceae bacterium]MBK7117696.1 hypothetical protein [Comamonadaceae bacterium]
MNNFEKSLMAAARKTFVDYEKLTGGWWLMHGPESFLQNGIALDLRKQADILVYPECSPKRVKADHNIVKIGRPPKTSQQQRFDLVTWWKNGTPRAIVELKLAYDIRPIRKDAEKLLEFRKEARDVFRSGYLLVYSEARIKPKKEGALFAAKTGLENRFDLWTKYLKEFRFKEIDRFAKQPPGEVEGYICSYGFVLYRIDF